MIFFFFGRFCKICLAHPYTTASLTFLVHWQSSPNVACRGCMKSSNLDPIFDKTNKIPSWANPIYLSPFSKLRFLKWTTGPTIKRKPIYYLLLADSIEPMLVTCLKEVHNHWFLCDSWRPMGARHVWGRSVNIWDWLLAFPSLASPPPFTPYSSHYLSHSFVFFA